MQMPKQLQLQLRMFKLMSEGVQVSIQAHPGAEKLSREEQAEEILKLLDKLEEVN